MKVVCIYIYTCIHLLGSSGLLNGINLNLDIHLFINITLFIMIDYGFIHLVFFWHRCHFILFFVATVKVESDHIEHEKDAKEVTTIGPGEKIKNMIRTVSTLEESDGNLREEVSKMEAKTTPGVEGQVKEIPVCLQHSTSKEFVDASETLADEQEDEMVQVKTESNGED